LFCLPPESGFGWRLAVSLQFRAFHYYFKIHNTAKSSRLKEISLGASDQVIVFFHFAKYKIVGLSLTLARIGLYYFCIMTSSTKNITPLLNTMVLQQDMLDIYTCSFTEFLPFCSKLYYFSNFKDFNTPNQG